MPSVPKRIAYVVQQWFDPAISGGHLRTAGIAQALAACGSLHVICIDFGGDARRRFADADRNARSETASLRPHAADPDRFTSRLWSEHDIDIHLRPDADAGLSTALRTWILERLHVVDPDLVVVDTTGLARATLPWTRSPVIFSTHNVDSEMMLSSVRADPSNLSGNRHRNLASVIALRHIEREVLPLGAEVWAVSEADRARYRSLGIANVAVVENTVADAWLQRPRPQPEPGRGVFIGTMNYAPNIHAASRIVELGRALRERGIPAEFLIGGTAAPDQLIEEINTEPTVSYAGFIDDLGTFYDQATAAIIPLGFGAGTKLKVAEAMAAGVPLLVTPESVAAMGPEIEADGNVAVIRPWGASFVEAAADILTNPSKYRSMAERAREEARRFVAGAVRTRVMERVQLYLR